METSLPPHVDAAVSEIRRAMAFVERRAINRTDVIKKMFCALLTREHVLLAARTGVGKSLLANQIFAMFEGARVFRMQASKEQQPDTYFGALDLEELKRANDYTLRALLTTLNERRLVRGIQDVPAEVHSVVGAANYIRVTEVTEAVLDRFLYKAVVEPDREPFFMYRISQQFVLHRGGIAEPDRKIPFETLKMLSNLIRGHDPEHEVKVPAEVMFFTNLVLRHYETLLRRARKQRAKEGGGGRPDFYISPRTQAKTLDALRSIAVMNRRLEVTLEDVAKMPILLCTAGVREEREIFQRAHESLSNHYTASHAFEQLHNLLELQDVIDRVQDDPKLLEQPIAELAAAPVKRSLVAWAKEKLGLGETEAEHNRRLLTEFIEGINPLTDEIRLLKMRLLDEIHHIYNPEDRGL
jgi:MoxR-like ATPase